MNLSDLDKYKIELLVKELSILDPVQAMDYCQQNIELLENLEANRTVFYPIEQPQLSKLVELMKGIQTVLAGNFTRPRGLSNDLWNQAKLIFQAMITRGELGEDVFDRIFPPS